MRKWGWGRGPRHQTLGRRCHLGFPPRVSGETAPEGEGLIQGKPVATLRAHNYPEPLAESPDLQHIQTHCQQGALGQLFVAP